MFDRCSKAPSIKQPHWTRLVLSVWMLVEEWLLVCPVEESLSSFPVESVRQQALDVDAGLRINRDLRAEEWPAAHQVSCVAREHERVVELVASSLATPSCLQHSKPSCRGGWAQNVFGPT